jgi:hypothetical protein
MSKGKGRKKQQEEGKAPVEAATALKSLKLKPLNTAQIGFDYVCQ